MSPYAQGTTLDDIADVLDGAHRYDHYLVARCPFHDDTRPSFFVYPDKYRCLSCGAFGETSRLLEKISPSHTVVRVGEFRNPFTTWLKDHDLGFILRQAYQYRPSHYLETRGISAAIQARLGIGKLDNWITFPIWDHQHKIVGAVARAGEGMTSRAKYVLPSAQSSSLLYVPSWKRIITEPVVFVVFGIIDAVTLFMLGYACASTTTGKQVNPNIFDHIRKRIVIIPDLGEEKEAHQLASKLGWRGNVAKLDYPERTKDINDILQVLRDHNQVRGLIEASYEHELGRRKRDSDRTYSE